MGKQTLEGQPYIVEEDGAWRVELRHRAEVLETTPIEGTGLEGKAAAFAAKVELYGDDIGCVILQEEDWPHLNVVELGELPEGSVVVQAPAAALVATAQKPA